MWLDDDGGAIEEAAAPPSQTADERLHLMEAELARSRKELADVRKELAAKVCALDNNAAQIRKSSLDFLCIDPPHCCPLQTVQLLRKDTEKAQQEKAHQESAAAAAAAAVAAMSAPAMNTAAAAAERERLQQIQMQLVGKVQEMEIMLSQKEEVCRCGLTA